MKKSILSLSLLLLFLSVFNFVSAQESVILKGQIVDKSTREPLLGVNVVEIDKNGRFIVGTITDMNGNYVLKVSSGEANIQVSYIGYQKQTINVKSRTQINIELESESLKIDEITVEGTRRVMSTDGYTRVQDRTTAVARLEFTEMKSVMTTTVEEMLQGRIGNVDITAVSGDPGAGLNIRIRGTASLNARNSPLIVVNGIPYDAQIDDNFDFTSANVEQFGNLIDVSPEDIESIEVLKDAASTAVWGSKASNGVLMIRTKRGIKSKPIFEYTYKFVRAEEPPSIPMLDGAGYARLITESHYNDTRNEFYDRSIAFDPEWEEYYNYSQNTNWVKEITRIAHTNQHDFSVRGGGDKSKYNMSLGYFDEEGTTLGNRLKKLNLRSSLDYDLSSKLQFRSDIMFTRYDQSTTYDVEDDEFGNWKQLRSTAYRKMPNVSIYERDTLNNIYDEYFTPTTTLQGTARNYYNPVAFANLGVQDRDRDNARALFSIRYKILPNLLLNSTVTLDIFDSKTHKFLPYKAIGYNYSDDITNRAVNEFYKKSSLYTMNQLIFTPTIGEGHELMVVGQFDTEETINRWFKVETSQSASPFSQQPVGDKHLVWMGNNFSKYRSMGFFLTANYIYKAKYIFMVGAKAEGNSKFSKESRWGIFPTLSAAWRISNEAFLKDVKFINELKFRFSWGQSGNSPGGNYLYFNTYKAGSDISYLDMQGVRPNGLELTSLQWETIEQINPGVSFFAFNNRINIEFDYYKKKTFDLYLENSGIPNHTGFGSINRNDGEMENRGLEAMLDFKIVKRDNLEVAINLNMSRNQNVVIRLPENYSLEYGDMLANGEYKISIQPGQAIGGFYGYKYKGVYPTDADAIVLDKDGNPVFGLNKDVPLQMILGGSSAYVFEGGDAMYDDLNHDGKIDDLDVVYLGNLNPDYMGGAGGRIQYKGFVFNVFFHFKVGQTIINQTRIDTEKMHNYDNQSLATNWRWRRPGDTTDIPRALYNKGYNWLGSDRFVEDGSFIRLKTVSLSYYVPPRFSEKIGIKELKVFATAYNLYTWTNYSGQDPDVSPPSNPSVLPKDYSKTPPSKRLMLGINITF